ncbi:MarR family transcriptional regulator [Pandoraea pneumonica]|jgi:DNA-binding MarR family transcriptional regulator|uniref:MarR family transcriptional regulator n=1 Tax=Pandoraea pneumonica TaxID=2508299 RepID=A0A5E4VXD2_9BURK|nr:MarR family transcriptional regulator [Pandoraea pneumonica]VVE17287.1 MarR family transcriptional regulator [Pandoraea pneumonica]
MPTPLKRNVIQQLSLTYRAMMSAFDAQVGHPLPRWRIIYALAERGTCSQKFLAEHCRLDPAQLTRQLQSMEALGWLTRVTDPDDNRLTNVTLTDAGKQVHDEATPRRQAFFDDALDGMSAADIAALENALVHLEARFKSVSSRARSGEGAVKAAMNERGSEKGGEKERAKVSDAQDGSSEASAAAPRKRASKAR